MVWEISDIVQIDALLNIDQLFATGFSTEGEGDSQHYDIFLL